MQPGDIIILTDRATQNQHYFQPPAMPFTQGLKHRRFSLTATPRNIEIHPSGSVALYNELPKEEHLRVSDRFMPRLPRWFHLDSVHRFLA